MTVVKAGVGVAGFEFGTGLVVSRIGVDQWSPPCAIGSTSASVGAMAGAQISDHVFLLMTDKAVDIMSSNDGSVQLGADIGIAVGPIGRSAEVDMGIGPKERVAPIYTYSQSKGFYAGISLDGKIVMTRHEVNEKFYGCPVLPRQLFGGAVPTPLAAQPLYDALKRCSVYAILSKRGRSA
jgi:lipid-binding SYLF domain-containing protein